MVELCYTALTFGAHSIHAQTHTAGHGYVCSYWQRTNWAGHIQPSLVTGHGANLAALVSPCPLQELASEFEAFLRPEDTQT